ncbi:hypothetical protein D2L64_01840 [Micromonospora radicis]|uniref:Uncharacterized protein n=1 Tax=Micromonospora radicis TaxID=1894971 RepID=A0A418N0X8_9ACTN|nr:hypothetical protein D2L64_01840 [Micromonospora radicis]
MLLAGCGPDAGDPAPAAGGSTADTGGASPQADGGKDTDRAEPAGADSWCEVVKAFNDSVEPLFEPGASGAKGDAAQAHARLRELVAAAPAEIKTEAAALSEFYGAVIDTSGKSMAEDPDGFARLAKAAEHLREVMPPVSDYTMKYCPELDAQLPMGDG